MTADDFRRIALGMDGAIESAHMGHPDFRANGKIFATIHHDHKWGMVKLTPDQQEIFVKENPGVFAPESGAWGRSGCTKVRLDAVHEDTLGEAMTLAWQNTAKAKRPTKAVGSPRKASGSRRNSVTRSLGLRALVNQPGGTYWNVFDDKGKDGFSITLAGWENLGELRRLSIPKPGLSPTADSNSQGIE